MWGLRIPASMQAPTPPLAAGVYFQSIVDHSDNLPNVTIFCHAKPLHHNPDWLQWVDCLRSLLPGS